MNASELTVAVSALANALASGLSVSELALAASIFVQIGDTLATIAAANDLRKEREDSEEE